MYGLMMLEGFLVVILIMPASQTIRGHALTFSKLLWRSHSFRALAAAVLLMQGGVFGEAMRNIGRLEEHDHIGIAGEYYNHANLLRNQRNAYIAGFGLFMTFLIWRLLALLTSLHEAEEEKRERRAKLEGVEHQPLVS